MIRQPVVAFVGHVDHGKSSILEFIKEVPITKKEAGGITQAIKAYTVPFEKIKKICGTQLESLKQDVTIPGILFIDTPGHAAFTSLRKRGGNISDIAILVIDINEGLKPQTIEAIEILKTFKTPFVVALNKIDSIQGWRPNKSKPVLQNIKSQAARTQTMLDERLYEILGNLFTHGIQSERFDRVEDFTKTVAIIPISAKTGEGIPELLMIITGLCQKYLEDSLKIEVSGTGSGTLLEVNDERGLGTTLNMILYDGTIKINDTIVIGGVNSPITTKVRSIRLYEGKKFTTPKSISAAASINIIAPSIKDAVPGMPIKVATPNSLEEIKVSIQKEISESIIETEEEGIVLKADSLGGLEALTKLLKEKKVPIKKTGLGGITKKDIATAAAAKNDINKVILAFNIPTEKDSSIKIIQADVVYKIIEDYERWVLEEEKKNTNKEFEGVTRPAKLEFLQHYVFRQSNPAIIGVRIIGGKIKVGMILIKDGKELARIKEIQHEKENVTDAVKGQEVAIALPGITVSRQINEGDIMYSDITENEYLKLKKLKSFLNPEEVEILKEIAQIKRKIKKLWGV
ncbi:MAG: translation initiation factor IF-2 [Nanoarchaeota archaeon]